MSSQDQYPLAGRLLSAGGGFRLTVRTSMLSEFRAADGILAAFEVSCRFTSVGGLCTALARLPGVHFEGARTCLWSQGPNRFTFKGHLYEVSAPYEDVRIAPAEAGIAYRETDELLRLVVENLVPKWQNRTRSRYFRL